MAYDAPRYNIGREIQQRGIAGASSSTMAKFAMLNKSRLKKVHWLVETAGTNAAAGFDVFVGTSSVAKIVFGTDAANVIKSTPNLNVLVPAGSYIELKGLENSATAVGAAIVEYEILPDEVTS